VAAFKDELGPTALEEIGASFAAADDGFPTADFHRLALAGLEELELKARVLHIMSALREVLPANYKQALPKLLAAMPHGTTEAKVSGAPDHLPTPAGLRGFAAWPVIDFVGKYGLDEPELSLQALPKLTSYFSAEFAIRPFLIEHEKLALRHMKRWAAEEDQHVRRLASEGSRPILPWGIRLPGLLKDPDKVLPILQQLPKDPANYVRRSVANHMNDISKNHPQWMIARLKDWGGTDLPWIRHALRTLIKNGHAEVWPLLGYDQDVKVEVAKFQLTPAKIRMGEELCLSLDLKLKQDASAPVVIDYVLHLVRANGSRTPKVFKWKNTALADGKLLQLTKRHSFKAVTTRRYYAGGHRIEIQINGRVLTGQEFELVEG